jgi:hypothetical protein
LSTRLRLGLPSGLFPSGFPTNILYAFLFSIRATYPAYLILLEVPIVVIINSTISLDTMPCSRLSDEQIPSIFRLSSGCLVYSSTPNMEAMRFFETLLHFCQTTRRRKPVDSTLHSC